MKLLSSVSVRSKVAGGDFPEVGKVTLAEAQKDPNYRNLITSLINRSCQILKILFSSSVSLSLSIFQSLWPIGLN